MNIVEMNIVIELEEGGAIKSIITDKENCKAIVVDRYVEGLEDAEIKVIENEEAYVVTDEVTVSSERVHQIFSEAGITPAQKVCVDHQKALITESVDIYCDANGITLTEEQRMDAIRGVDFWLSEVLDQAVADTIYPMVDDNEEQEEEEDTDPLFNETIDSFEKVTIEEFNQRYGCNATKEMNIDAFADFLEEDDELSFFCISFNGQDVLNQVYDEWEVASRLKIDYLLIGNFYVAIY